MASNKVIALSVWLVAMVVVMYSSLHGHVSETPIDASATVLPQTPDSQPRPTPPARQTPPAVKSWAHVPKFRDVPTPERDVECTLSNFAKQVRLNDKFLRICKETCFPHNSEKNNSAPRPSLPPFCIAEKQFKSAKFSFTGAAEEVEVPHKTTLILTALGDRFYGAGGQSYVLESIRQWRLFHTPDLSDVILILDEKLADDSRITEYAKEYSVELIKAQSIQTAELRRFYGNFYIQGLMHPGGSRKTGNLAFNQLVSERFFAIHAVMQSRQLKHVLHMENDIMVYENMAGYVAASARCNARLASTIVHTKGFIPSIIYIRDADAIAHFNEFLNNLLGCGKSFGHALAGGPKVYANDMTYLMNYYEYFGSEYLTVLPSWEHKPGESCINDQVGGTKLFDVASFGQWLSFAVKEGTSVPPLHIRNAMKGRFLDATPPPKVEWKVDGEGRRTPHWKKYALSSLHIHAKNLDKFRSK